MAAGGRGGRASRPGRPPSSVPAMASEAPATASRGLVSFGTMDVRMKDSFLVNAEIVRPRDAAGSIRGMPPSLVRGAQAAHDLIK